MEGMTNKEKSLFDDCLCEPGVSYRGGRTLFDLDDIFGQSSNRAVAKVVSATSDDVLQPIIKWAGGKEKELKYIIPNAPVYNNYYEPFVGGGSVFAAIRAGHFYINDLSAELMTLYKNIARGNRLFYKYAEAIDKTWDNAHCFFVSNGELRDKYLEYRTGEISKEGLKTYIATFCAENASRICAVFEQGISFDRGVLLDEMYKNLYRKMSRMRELEQQKHLLPDGDLNDNIETAIKSAVYMCLRSEYNRLSKGVSRDEYHSALFLFIRNYCYSGMFRYNDDGDFNVPYGGIAYNGKSMRKKINYYKSAALVGKFANTDIYNLDFEAFLEKVKPGEDDFVFLDPPYDSEFSTYAKNEFSKKDQKRLADYLIDRCKAKWMMIIKNTDFIFDLYNRPGINIKTFDKEYLVSFMNRNDKKVTHLLITNY